MFTRTCYSMGNQSWLVVDLPTRLMDISSNSRWQLPFIRSCLVSPYTTQSASNVIWIEMTQFLLDEVHPLYHHLCGQVFSSERWFRTLTEECCRRARIHIYLSPLFAATSEKSAALEQLVTLAKEMSARFYSGLSAATPHFKIQACALREVSFAMDGPYWTATKTVMFKV
ncbi:hypothetical protein F2Q69_00058146 [Brassica cretica]|uniref:Uncharacterized protein n=1 Tax=Brassica cretica TaxID=69181 RepID=A0A8S9RNG6_BRACR|nr:hypothetical protein F2Q69_00058146 [Brassica cretica]